MKIEIKVPHFRQKIGSNLVIFQKLKFSSLEQIVKLKYTRKAIKVKQNSAAARLAAAAHASLCKEVTRLKKKGNQSKKFENSIFRTFVYFRVRTCIINLR